MMFIHDLDNFIRKLQNRENVTNSLRGAEYNAGQDETLLPDSFLHQAGDNVSEIGSALFEQNNPEMMKFYQSTKKKLFDTLE